MTAVKIKMWMWISCVLKRRISDYWQTLNVYAMPCCFVSFALVGIPYPSVFCCLAEYTSEYSGFTTLNVEYQKKHTYSTDKEHANVVVLQFTAFVFILCLLNFIRECIFVVVGGFVNLVGHKEPLFVIPTLHFHFYYCFSSTWMWFLQDSRSLSFLRNS